MCGYGERGVAELCLYPCLRDPASMGISQALADDVRVIGDGNFGIIDIGMPKFFPFETVKALIAD